jgi:hypothetical protein
MRRKRIPDDYAPAMREIEREKKAESTVCRSGGVGAFMISRGSFLLTLHLVTFIGRGRQTTMAWISTMC